MSSVFFNKGENCIAAGRLFVEETIHDQFVKKVVRVCPAESFCNCGNELPCMEDDIPPGIPASIRAFEFVIFF